MSSFTLYAYTELSSNTESESTKSASLNVENATDQFSDPYEFCCSFID